MKTVSAVMVFHKTTPYFEPAVRSVLEQTWGDLELVLVSNGSEGGLSVLGQLATDSRVRIVQLPRNLGIPGGLEVGLAAARGEFAMLLDYDDIALPQRAERQVAALRADERLGLVSSQVDIINARSAVMRRDFSLLQSEEQQRYLRFSMPVVTPAFSGRLAAFRAYRHRPEFHWASDYDQVTRIVEHWRIGAVPEVLTHYREHQQQTTVQRRDEMLLEIALVRLLTARRRAGRSEGFQEVVGWLQEWRGSRPQTFYPKLADRFRAEGFSDLAVYHARRTLIFDRRPASLAWALSILFNALRCRPLRPTYLLNLFFRGPIAALRLHPNIWSGVSSSL